MEMTAKRLIDEGTRTPAATVIRTKRLVSRNHLPGLVKIELRNVQDKIAVLRNKRNLGDNPEFRRVFLRSSKPHHERIAEFNFKKVLQQLPNGSDYWIVGSGRIIGKNEHISPNYSSAMPMGHSGTVEGYSPNVTRLDTPISALSDDHPGDHSFVAASSQGEHC